jgi:hypothetical protein
MTRSLRPCVFSSSRSYDVLVGFSSLSEVERNTVRQAMQAVLDGSWIDDSEFGTRLGFERESLREILRNWPLLDDSGNGVVGLAINNCMNEVCHGIDISGYDWNVWFTQSKDAVKATFSKWLDS